MLHEQIEEARALVQDTLTHLPQKYSFRRMHGRLVLGEIEEAYARTLSGRPHAAAAAHALKIFQETRDGELMFGLNVLVQLACETICCAAV